MCLFSVLHFLFIKIFSLFFLVGCKEKIKKNISTAENENLIKAIKFRDSANEDSAYVYYVKAKEELLKNRNNTEAARALVNIAIIETNKGDYHSSIENSIEAEKLLKNKKKKTQMGVIRLELILQMEMDFESTASTNSAKHPLFYYIFSL